MRLLALLALALPSYGAVALVAHQVAHGVNGATTSAIDTTGANFIVMAVSAYTGGPADSVSDSKSNSWTALSTYTYSGGFCRVTLYYTTPSSVGTSHTFSNSGSGNYTSVAVAAFSGLASSSVFLSGTDVGAASSVGWDTLTNFAQPGSSTAGSGDLIVTAAAPAYGTATVTFSGVNTGYTIIDQYHSSGVTEGIALAWKTSTGAAENPLWTFDINWGGPICAASFDAASGGGARRRIIND